MVYKVSVYAKKNIRPVSTRPPGVAGFVIERRVRKHDHVVGSFKHELGKIYFELLYLAVARQQRIFRDGEDLGDPLSPSKFIISSR